MTTADNNKRNLINAHKMLSCISALDSGSQRKKTGKIKWSPWDPWLGAASADYQTTTTRQHNSTKRKIWLVKYHMTIHLGAAIKNRHTLRYQWNYTQSSAEWLPGVPFSTTCAACIAVNPLPGQVVTRVWEKQNILKGVDVHTYVTMLYTWATSYTPLADRILVENNYTGCHGYIIWQGKSCQRQLWPRHWWQHWHQR